jgi:hypothetical protein
MKYCINKVISILATSFYKNNKVYYYIKNYLKILFLPIFKFKDTYSLKNKTYNSYILDRVDYYNKLNILQSINSSAKEIKEFTIKNHLKTYYFDSIKYLKYFNKSYKFNYIFGDVNYLPKVPSIVKSRPISKENNTAILLNLNRIKHFTFIKDLHSINKKTNQLVWRGNIWPHQTQRIDFLKSYYNHPLCNVGYVNNQDFPLEWKKEKLNMHEQLRYKFILSIEGNDVATNLKWVMSSNSVVVMRKPRFETWFMEGRLIPDYHYIHIEDDYSNLIEKLEYYINNPKKTIQINKNAKNFVKQFKNKKQEKLISLLVLNKYFEKTGQYKNV